MEIEQYLTNRLKTCGHYFLTDIDKQSLSSLDIKQFIFQKVMTKKFRKWSVNLDFKQRIKSAINTCVNANKPIKFILPFGGYKLWRLPSAPETDWADFFALAYFYEYLAPLATVYPPGVELILLSDDIIIEKMNNMPHQDISAYLDSFNILLQIFQQYQPTNLNIKITRVADLYETSKFEKEINQLIDEIKQKLPNWDEEKKKILLKTSRLNIQLAGETNLSNLSPEKLEEIIESGIIYHEAYRQIEKKIELENSVDTIPLATKPTSRSSIVIGSTKCSAARFWTGFGVLELIESNKLNERILTYSQWAQTAKQIPQTSSISLIPLKNFQTIKIYEFIKK